MSKEGPLYPNQPLMEVAAEVRFKGDLSIEGIRAGFQREIESRYPYLFVPDAFHGVAPSLQPFRFEADRDHTCGVQLAINSLSYFSKKYPGFHKFISDYEAVAKPFWELIEKVSVTRVGWRYINSIPFVREGEFLPLGHFFKENRFLGPGLNCRAVSVNHRIVTIYEECFVSIRLESTGSLEDSGEESILLDIDVYHVQDQAQLMDQDSAYKAVVEKHDIARSVFEELITEDYRTFLKGGKNV